MSVLLTVEEDYAEWRRRLAGVELTVRACLLLLGELICNRCSAAIVHRDDCSPTDKGGKRSESRGANEYPRRAAGVALARGTLVADDYCFLGALRGSLIVSPLSLSLSLNFPAGEPRLVRVDRVKRVIKTVCYTERGGHR